MKTLFKKKLTNEMNKLMNQCQTYVQRSNHEKVQQLEPSGPLVETIRLNTKIGKRKR